MHAAIVNTKRLPPRGHTFQQQVEHAFQPVGFPVGSTEAGRNSALLGDAIDATRGAECANGGQRMPCEMGDCASDRGVDHWTTLAAHRHSRLD
eukprot:2439075-Prymnesium_polylepis.3